MVSCTGNKIFPPTSDSGLLGDSDLARIAKKYDLCNELAHKKELLTALDIALSRECKLISQENLTRMKRSFYVL